MWYSDRFLQLFKWKISLDVAAYTWEWFNLLRPWEKRIEIPTLIIVVPKQDSCKDLCSALIHETTSLSKKTPVP